MKTGRKDGNLKRGKRDVEELNGRRTCSQTKCHIAGRKKELRGDRRGKLARRMGGVREETGASFIGCQTRARTRGNGEAMNCTGAENTPGAIRRKQRKAHEWNYNMPGGRGSGFLLLQAEAMEKNGCSSPRGRERRIESRRREGERCPGRGRGRRAVQSSPSSGRGRGRPSQTVTSPKGRENHLQKVRSRLRQGKSGADGEH